MSAATFSGPEFYLNMPLEEFVEFNNEVAERWRATR